MTPALVWSIAGAFVLGGLGFVLTRRLGVAIGAAFAGAVMAAMVVDYLWYPMARAQLPEGEDVGLVTRETSILRPWSYVAAPAVRFVAVVTDGARPHGDNAGERIVPLHFVGRLEPELTVDMLYDCRGLGQVPITDRIRLNADGTVPAPDWRPVSEDDTLLRLACAADLAGN